MPCHDTLGYATLRRMKSTGRDNQAEAAQGAGRAPPRKGYGQTANWESAGLRIHEPKSLDNYLMAYMHTLLSCHQS